MIKASVSKPIERNAILAYDITRSRNDYPLTETTGFLPRTTNITYGDASVSHTWLQHSTNDLQETRVSWPNEPWSLWFRGEHDSDKSRIPILELSPEPLTPERPSLTTWETTTTKEVVLCNQKQIHKIKRRIRRRSQQ